MSLPRQPHEGEAGQIHHDLVRPELEDAHPADHHHGHGESIRFETELDADRQAEHQILDEPSAIEGPGIPAPPSPLVESKANDPSPEREREHQVRQAGGQPRSDELQGLAIEKSTVPSVEEVVGAAEVVHNDATQEPLLNLAPKRPNWDLKRDLEPQMKRLRAMTDRAIVKLIAERVAQEEGEGGDAQRDGPNLAQAVSQTQRADREEEDDGE